MEMPVTPDSSYDEYQCILIAGSTYCTCYKWDLRYVRGKAGARYKQLEVDPSHAYAFLIPEVVAENSLPIMRPILSSRSVLRSVRTAEGRW